MRSSAFTVLLAVAALTACAADRFATGHDSDGGSDGAASDDAAATGDAGDGGVTGQDGGGGGDAGGEGGGLGASCNPFAPCATGFYCDSTACGAGSCRPTSPSTNNQYSPVCGCDGITYFNPSVAVAYGVSIRSSNVCAKNDSATKVCGGLQMDPCGGSAKCGMVTISTNCTTPAGICWQLPPTCPATPAIKFCGASCGSVCDAIAAQIPYYADTGCP